MRRLGAGLILLPFLLIFVLSSVYSQESPPKVDEKNAAAIVEYLESVFRYENDGTGSLISQVRVQIKTPQGLQAFGQVYFPFR